MAQKCFNKIMGWSVPKQNRIKLLRESGALLDPQKHVLEGVTHVVVDLNTQVRLVTTGPDVSAVLAAHRLIARATGNFPAATLVVLADDSTKLPPIRAAVQRKRLRILEPAEQAKQERMGKIIVDRRAFKPGTEPYSAEALAGIATKGIYAKVNWTRLLASSAGKKVAYTLLVEALKTSAQMVVRDPQFRLLVWHTGDTPYTFPNNWDPRFVESITDNAYGEADERVTEAIRAIESWCSGHAPNIIVRTIDTDMLIQVLVADIAQPTTASLTIQFKNEWVDAFRWKAFFQRAPDESENELASRALMLCFSSGCDYNDGLTPYGYRNAAILKAAVSEPLNLCTLDREADTCSFDLVAIAHVLRKLKRASPLKDKGEFQQELENATYTVAYFSGVKRKCGGPEQQRAHVIKARADATDESELGAFLTFATDEAYFVDHASHLEF